MFDFIKGLKQRWNDWCGDREMEISIRRKLTDSGYFGNSAKLRNVRLVAVQRPGWIQVFRFEASARVELPVNDDLPDAAPEYHELFGLVREDMRKNSSVVKIWDNEADRKIQFAQWSEDLICLRGAHGLGN